MLLEKVKETLRQSPPWMFATAFSARNLISPSRPMTIATASISSTGYTKFHLGARRKTYFPDRSSFWKYESFESCISLNEKRYLEAEDVSIGSGDVVIDIGAFMGGFSALAARQSAESYAFEPDPTNAACLRKNTSSFENITVREWALWDSTGEVNLNIGTHRDDSSILAPDRGDTQSIVSVPSYTIADAMDTLGVEFADLVKIEAEGAEPEVAKGIDSSMVGKVIVLCSDERDGESPKNEVLGILDEKGYSTKTFKNLVIGTDESV